MIHLSHNSGYVVYFGSLIPRPQLSPVPVITSSVFSRKTLSSSLISIVPRVQVSIMIGESATCLMIQAKLQTVI
jgi:hypothetical protein